MPSETLGRPNGQADNPGRIKQPFSWTWLTALSWFVVGCVVGLISGLFGRKAFAFTFSAEWDIPDILTVLVTLIVALYVQHYVVERSASRKDQRGYLITLLHNVSTAADGVLVITREPTVDNRSAGSRKAATIDGVCAAINERCGPRDSRCFAGSWLEMLDE